MRNIYQYPLTAEEAHDVLARQQQVIAQRQDFGGISGHALERVVEFLKQNDAQFRAFLAQGR
jgi:hypothetical protein